MIAASDIVSALATHNARLVVEGDRIQVTSPSDRPPPPDLIEAAKANRESLRALPLANLAKMGHQYSTGPLGMHAAEVEEKAA